MECFRGNLGFDVLYAACGGAAGTCLVIWDTPRPSPVHARAIHGDISKGKSKSLYKHIALP